MTHSLYPVILAGGSGTRLWPLSRKNFPKQFLCLQGEQTLLQQTVQRVLPLASERFYVVSNEAHYFLCQEQLASVNTPINYILEPCARNTAPAIAAVAHCLIAHDPNALMVVLPSDHWIADAQSWQAAVIEATQLAAEQDCIVTFGITPTSPKTGYGYIEAGEKLPHTGHKIIRFCEKPSQEVATDMLAQGNFFWNSGMFICKASVYLSELARHANDILEQTKLAVTHATEHNDFLRLHPEHFARCRSESIDYALMEYTQKAAVIPLNVEWNDLGCWSSVAETHTMDEHGNALQGPVLAKESSNCLIHTDQQLVTTIGIHNQIIVATADAILVADKQYSQQVKQLVEKLSADNPQIIHDHQRVIRPWGYYEVLAEGASFKVKRLMVKPGAKLSLQMHQHRAEHWVVVQGHAEVVNDNQLIHLTVNQSTYIPQKTKHRLANNGNEPLYVIEVQSGSYLGEDDIQRFDDVYQRDMLSTV